MSKHIELLKRLKDREDRLENGEPIPDMEFDIAINEAKKTQRAIVIYCLLFTLSPAITLIIHHYATA